MESLCRLITSDEWLDEDRRLRNEPNGSDVAFSKDPPFGRHNLELIKVSPISLAVESYFRTDGRRLPLGPAKNCASRGWLFGLSRFEVVLLASLVLLNTLYLINVPLRWHHAVTVIIITIACFVSISSPQRAVTKGVLVVSFLSLPIVCRTVVLMDLAGSMYLAAYLGTIVALIIVGTLKQRLSLRVLFLYLALGVIPGTVISAAKGPTAYDDPEAPSGNIKPALIPSASTNWRINVGPYGSTFHYTSDLAVVLFAIALVGLPKQKFRCIALLGVSLYLLAFSGARSGLVAATAVAALFAVNRRLRRPLWACGIVAATIVGVYTVNTFQMYLPQFENETVRALIPVTRMNGSDATTNRSWLWRYHLKLLSYDPWSGAGLEGVRLPHRTVFDKRSTPGSSESYYTSLLGAFGISGVSIIGIHLYIFIRTLRDPDLLKVLFGAIMIIETVVNSMFATMYSAVPLFMMAYICTNLDGWIDCPAGLVYRRFASRAR